VRDRRITFRIAVDNDAEWHKEVTTRISHKKRIVSADYLEILFLYEILVVLTLRAV